MSVPSSGHVHALAGQPALRILLITNDFPHASQPTRGIFNFQMAAALAEQHEVAVIAHVPWVSEWKRRARFQPITAVPAPSRIKIWHPWYYYPPGLQRAHHGWVLWRSIAALARRVVANFKPDVVLAYWLHPDGEAAVRIAREAGIPVVVMSGGSDVLVVARDPRRRRRMIAVLTAADAVVCVSEHLRRAVTAFGIAAGKIHVVYRGVDPERFHPGNSGTARAHLGLSQDRPLLLWVGRMAPVKGLETLVDACAALKAEGLDFTLALVGDGSGRDRLAARVERLGLDDVVRFAGSVTHDQLGDWYRAASLVVLPSLSEGVPNVLLEAIACGTPFVASDVGGVSEIADGGHDRLVSPASTPELAGAIRESLVRSRVGKRRFEPDTWAASAERLADVFRSTLRSSSAGLVAAEFGSAHE